jgi:hypothetical protein
VAAEQMADLQQRLADMKSAYDRTADEAGL